MPTKIIVSEFLRSPLPLLALFLTRSQPSLSAVTNFSPSCFKISRNCFAKLPTFGNVFSWSLLKRRTDLMQSEAVHSTVISNEPGLEMMSLLPLSFLRQMVYGWLESCSTEKNPANQTTFVFCCTQRQYDRALNLLSKKSNEEPVYLQIFCSVIIRTTRRRDSGDLDNDSQHGVVCDAAIDNRQPKLPKCGAN